MAADRRLTPKTLLLDLLRVARPASVPVQALVNVGKLFGQTDNALRVALTRLGARGLVESDERGSYRLAPSSDPVSEHVEAWRRGDARTRAWDGRWLAVWLPRGGTRTARRHSMRGLAMLGFAEGLEGLRVRPDNLRGGVHAVRRRLVALGLEDGAELFAAHGFEDALVERWAKRLWPLARLERDYDTALGEIERSTARVARLPLEQAVVETFRVGGNAIRVLATDPLLPDAILCSKKRCALTDAMLAYDRLGREVWARLAARSAPPRLELVAGGAA